MESSGLILRLSSTEINCKLGSRTIVSHALVGDKWGDEDDETIVR